MGVWKVPTGLVDAKEDLHIAAVREVKEETGMRTLYIA
jgi:ADP-ribose pyrophosphatase YjhB (NUDIX family)